MTLAVLVAPALVSLSQGAHPQQAAVDSDQVTGPDAPRVQVRRVALVGNTVVTDEVLAGIAAPYEGKELTLADLKEIAERVTQHYHDQGYFLAQVVVPEQDIQDGTVTLRVLEGQLGAVTITGNRRYSDKRVRAAFSGVPKKKVIRHQPLERAMLILNEQSGIQATCVLEAGEQTGTTDIVVTVVEDSDAEGSFRANNFGTKLSSRYRSTSRVSFPNLTGRGDALGLQLVAAPDFSDVLFGQMDYSVPISSQGTRAYAHLVGGKFEVGGDFALLNMRGEGISGGGGISHALHRSRGRSVTLSGGIEFDNSEQSLLGSKTSDDRIRKFVVALNTNETDDTGRNFLEVGVEQGLGSNLGGMPNRSRMSSRSFSGADNRFTKIRVDFTRVHRVSPRLSLIGRAAAQYSTRPLVSGEQLSIGGADSVRGHPQSAFLGDDGVTASIEARYSPSRTHPERLQIAAFADHGTVKTKKPAAGQSKRHSISGVGVGVRAELPDEFSVRADVGVHLGAGPISGPTLAPYIEVSKRF